MKAILMPVKGEAAKALERVLQQPSVGEKLSAQERERIAESIWMNAKHEKIIKKDQNE
ncbi:hypothetical protein [uncultured Dubosiella sp.]|uniref:hypothetical protein n=1 Tax=uncultured Dubosiella sp. TaxID=1937011 RepID=UPI0025B3DCE6|nr:hypothetical protein [uncultured Dubosiella sp.]